VTAINFEAGDHAMPQNPAEIDLALRAGGAAWARFPYLECRFGSRGRRFTSSDSCWLVALTRLPVDTATKNLEWLRGVLASRGLPTTILEWHLRAIVRSLTVEFPERVEMPDRFLPFLSNLEVERGSLGGITAQVEALIEGFDRKLRGCAGPGVDSAAELVASAWIDERSGIAGALAAVLDWFTDPERFSSEWIATICDLVAELGQAARLPC
jgi:hypothetical protein